MNRLFPIVVLVAASLGCSSPRASTKRNDLLSGEATANKAGESARAAEKSGDSGVLIESSARPEGEAPESQPVAEAEPTEVVVLVEAEQTFVGDQVIDPAKYFEGLPKDGNQRVVVVPREGVKYARVVAVMDGALAAGFTDVVLRADEDESAEQTDDPETAPAEPADD